MPAETTVFLTLEGPRGIRQAVRTAADIAAALAGGGNLVLDCDGVTEADLSLIQTILAARRSAARSGASVTLHKAPRGALLHALRRGGFLPDQDTPLGAAAAAPACWAGAEPVA
jgi:ABC-type transporter Mla MlaB component